MAGWFVLTAVGALIAANSVLADRPGPANVARVGMIMLFYLGGFAGLVSSLAALRQGERSIVIWAAMLVGVATAAFAVAEFTIVE